LSHFQLHVYSVQYIGHISFLLCMWIHLLFININISWHIV